MGGRHRNTTIDRSHGSRVSREAFSKGGQEHHLTNALKNNTRLKGVVGGGSGHNLEARLSL
jgi:hypothetical protein